MALSRVNQHEFGPLVEAHITGNLLDIYRSSDYRPRLPPTPGFPVWRCYKTPYASKINYFATRFFICYPPFTPERRLKLWPRSLKVNTSVRANAAEALEAMTTPQTAKLIAPLFEPEMPLDELLEISHDTWEMSHPNTPEAIRQILTDPNDPWFRATV